MAPVHEEPDVFGSVGESSVTQEVRSLMQHGLKIEGPAEGDAYKGATT